MNDPIRSFVNAYDEALSNCKTSWVLTIIPIAFCLLILFKELTYGSKQKLKAME
jgi:hypothetical protein